MIELVSKRYFKFWNFCGAFVDYWCYAFFQGKIVSAHFNGVLVRQFVSSSTDCSNHVLLLRDRRFLQVLSTR
jgi:hypothetical protein